MSKSKKTNPVHAIKPWRTFLPLFFGLGVVALMIYKEKNFNFASLSFLKVSFYSVMVLIFAFLAMAVRDFGYMLRIRLLTDNQLSWRKAFRVIMLWEFTSTITPSAVGGTTVAMIYINKEGISLGRSTAAVMVTSFLDELYFIIAFPLMFVLVNMQQLFSIDGQSTGKISFANEFFYFAIIGYGLKLAYTLLLSYGLFINPLGLKWILKSLFKLPILRRWKQGAHTVGSDIVKGSIVYRRKPLKFWLKAFGATAIAWTARYWVVNIIFVAFFAIHDHFLLFARQLVMWNMMLVSPTPGGSGFAEFVFTRYLGIFLPSGVEHGTIMVALAFLWRVISYYPYLLIGMIIFPRWVKKHF